MRFSNTSVKRTVWPLRAIFDTFACFFTQVDQIGPHFSVVIVNLDAKSPHVLAKSSENYFCASVTPLKNALFGRCRRFLGFLPIYAMFGGSKPPLAAFQSKSSLHTKFAQNVQLHPQRVSSNSNSGKIFFVKRVFLGMERDPPKGVPPNDERYLMTLRVP